MDKKLNSIIKEAEEIKKDLYKLNARFELLISKIEDLSADTGSPVPKKVVEKSAGITKSAPSVLRAGKSILIGRKSYNLPTLLDALRFNNLTVIEDLRNSLAIIDGKPNEKDILSKLIAGGIPGVILTGTLKTAIIDGSNIAQMAKAKTGKLAYIENTKLLAYKNGYFPVITIVDASLRHNIDRPDDFMEMVESGEIVMAEPYTSADKIIISDALKYDAVVLTNDRFAEWSDAKRISKRHVVLNGKSLLLGEFHRSTNFLFR